MAERIGFRTAGYRLFPMEQALCSIASVGYDGVEICLEHPDCARGKVEASRCREMAKLAGELGLEIASVSYHGDQDDLEERWERALRAVQVTREFGADVLIVNSPRPGPTAPPDLRQQFREQLAAQLEAAETLGVLLALEPEPGLLVANCSDMLELIDWAGSPHLKVNLDVGHAFLTEDDLIASVRELAGHTVHTHFEDMPVGEHRHLVPGEGAMDLPAVLDALRCEDYSGYLTIDLFDIAEAPEEAARASFEYMRKLVS